jgi:ATP-dependent Lon protease
MVTALVSLLNGRRVRPRVAMTGEISLSGIVLPIGGVKEKVLGAKRAGIKEVILPADNEPNVKQDLQPEMLEGLQIHYVKTLDQVLEIALSKPEQPVAEASKPRTSEAVPAPQLGARSVH